MDFEHRTGPRPSACVVYPDNTVPEWYADAKLGLFVHWGIYSVPAWAVTGTDRWSDGMAGPYATHRYAEWYANTVRIEGSPTQRRHRGLYGDGRTYEDLADEWLPRPGAAASLAELAVDLGARYLVLTAKHHDGFCLWDSRTTPFTAARRGPRRDLVAETHDAARAAGLRFGAYYSGALDWHASDFRAIESDEDLFALRRNDSGFADYCARQLTELVDRFRPDLLWNDIDWPDAGKGPEPYGVASLLGRYFDRVPDGVVNDRWGVPYRGFLTREYAAAHENLATPWEATRGVGRSFGCNEAEGEEDTLTGAELVRLLVDVVGKNGNLLLNVGPRADGSIPERQARPIRELGAWLRRHGEAVYGTRPSPRARGGQDGVVLTRRVHDGGHTDYAHVLDPAPGAARIPGAAPGTVLRWLGLAGAHDGAGAARVDEHGWAAVPDMLRGEPVAVAALEEENHDAA